MSVKPYSKNFLNEVIIRLDFVDETPSINRILPESIARTAKTVLPISEVGNMFTQELQLSPQGFQSASNLPPKKEWKFSSRERKLSVSIGDKWIYITCSKYDSFESFFETFTLVADQLFAAFPDIMISRIGLRYVNNLVVQEIETPLSWSEYINEKYTGTLSLYDEKKYTRAISIIEIDNKDYMQKIQFGLFNPDYPSTILKKEFVIDIDCFNTGLTYIGDYKEIVKLMHAGAKSVFEGFITDKMRAKLYE